MAGNRERFPQLGEALMQSLWFNCVTSCDMRSGRCHRPVGNVPSNADHRPSSRSAPPHEPSQVSYCRYGFGAATRLEPNPRGSPIRQCLGAGPNSARDCCCSRHFGAHRAQPAQARDVQGGRSLPKRARGIRLSARSLDRRRPHRPGPAGMEVHSQKGWRPDRVGTHRWSGSAIGLHTPARRITNY